MVQSDAFIEVLLDIIGKGVPYFQGIVFSRVGCCLLA
jgi:hypothetical protein